MSGNWLDLSSSSNRYIQTYMKGFLDMSGGNLLLRNNNIIVAAGDISLNGRFFVNGDTSMNGRLFVSNDLSLNSRLFVGSDVSMNGNVYARGTIITDASSYTDVKGTFLVENNVNVTGIINQSTINLSGGYIYLPSNVTTEQYNALVGALTAVNSVIQTATAPGLPSTVGGGTVVKLGLPPYAGGPNIMAQTMADTWVSGNLLVAGSTTVNTNQVTGGPGSLYVAGSVNVPNGNLVVGGNVSLLNNTLNMTLGNITLTGGNVTLNNGYIQTSGNIMSTNGTVHSANDISVNGLVFGKGPGGNNIVLGSNLLSTANVYTINNLALGENSLTSISNNGSGTYGAFGSNNTTVGFSAGTGITYGNYNTAVGSNSGSSLTTGNSNTFLGGNTTTSSGAFVKSTAVGFGATIGGSNQIVLGTSTESVIVSGNVGIGRTGVPPYSLDVSGVGRFSSGATYTALASVSASNTPLVVSADTTGSYASDLGQIVISGKTNTALRLGMMIDTIGNVAKIQGGLSGSGTLPIALNPMGGNVGIGTNNPTYNLDVTGTARFTSDLSINGNVFVKGNIGIGTTVPTGKLHIYEAAGTGDAGAASGSLVIEHGNTGGVSSIIFPSKNNSGSSAVADYGYIRFRDDVNNSTSLEQGRLEIGTENDNGPAGTVMDALILQKSGGYVGIGTSNPTYKLDVSGTGRFTSDVSINGNLVVGGALSVQQMQSRNIINTTTTNYQLIVSEDLSLNGRLFVSGDASLNGRAYVSNNLSIGFSGAGLSLNSYPTYPSQLDIFGSILSNGITTTSPLCLSAHTALGGGSTFAQMTIRSGDYGAQALLISGGGSYPNGSGILQAKDLYRNSANRLLLNPDGGNVGIGTTAPSKMLTVAGDALINSLTVGTDLATNGGYYSPQYTLTIATAGTTYYRIGYVGATYMQQVLTTELAGQVGHIRITVDSTSWVGSNLESVPIQITTSMSSSFTCIIQNVYVVYSNTAPNNNTNGELWIKVVSGGGGQTIFQSWNSKSTADHSVNMGVAIGNASSTTMPPTGFSIKATYPINYTAGSGGATGFVGQNVGIGTTNPQVPLDVNHNGNNTVNVNYGGYQIRFSGPYQDPNSPGMRPIALRVQGGDVWFTRGSTLCYLYMHSDERIKTNILSIDDNFALQTFRKLQPRQYNYKDYIARGLASTYGFIAQEVYEHLPNAVSKNKAFIPNIFDAAKVIDKKIIKMQNKKTDLLLISETPEKVHPIKFYDKNDAEFVTKIKRIIDEDTFEIEDEISEENTFIYGQEVYDFHSLEKDVIYSVLYAGVKVIDNVVQSQQEEISDLKSRLASLESRLAAAGF